MTSYQRRCDVIDVDTTSFLRCVPTGIAHFPYHCIRKACCRGSQLAFYVNLHRAVIGPSATLTGRWRPDIDLRRMLTGITPNRKCQGRRDGHRRLDVVVTFCIYWVNPWWDHTWSTGWPPSSLLVYGIIPFSHLDTLRLSLFYAIINYYSQILMPVTRTPTARISWLIRTRFWIPRKFFW